MANIYTYPKKEDVEIIVGDEKQEAFKPRMKIKRWDNEVNFSVGVISENVGKHSKKHGKSEWNDGHGTKAVFYEKPDDQFEFEIELDSKPESNVLHLSMETKGLDFLYQPPLTEEALADTIVIDGEEVCRYSQPENVIGSYAVYHSTMSGNYLGGNNYRAGKFCHIYRPYASDAKGNKTWCDLNIDGEMQITIPQDFLDNAAYPVVVDPTFGCDPASPGSQWYICSADTMIQHLYTSPSNVGNAQSLSVYMHYGSGNLKGVITSSGGAILTNGIGGAVSITTYNWNVSTFSTDVSISNSTSYGLCYVANASNSAAYDTDCADYSYYDNTNSYGSPTNFYWIGSLPDLKLSIYCTYAATALIRELSTTIATETLTSSITLLVEVAAILVDTEIVSLTPDRTVESLTIFYEIVSLTGDADPTSDTVKRILQSLTVDRTIESI